MTPEKRCARCGTEATYTAVTKERYLTGGHAPTTHVRTVGREPLCASDAASLDDQGLIVEASAVRL